MRRTQIFSKRKSQLYAKLFLSLITCIVLTTMISSAVLYVRFHNIAMNMVYSDNLDSLTQTSNEVSIMTEMGKKLSYQIYSDLYISKLLYYSSPDVYDIMPAINQLSTYGVSMPFIDSIYIYNNTSENFFASSNNQSNDISNRLVSLHEKSDFIDKDIINLINNIDNYEIYQPIPRYFAYDVPTSDTCSCYSFIYYDPFSYDKKDSGIVVLNISENWIRDVMTAAAKSSLSDTFIIDSKGRLASNSKGHNMLTDISDKSYIKLIQSNTDKSGYLVDEINGVKSFITYTSPDTLGWRYIRVTPYNIIFRDIENMKQNLILICSFILFFSFLLAIVVSRFLSKPIDKKLINLKSLEAEKYNRSRILKQEFLCNLLMGRESANLQALRKTFEEYGIRLHPEKSILLFLLRIDNYKDFSQLYNIEDMNLYKFGIGNIVAELCSAYFTAEAVDMGEDRIVILINANRDDTVLGEEELQDLFHSFRKSIQEFVKVSVSITVSPAGSTMENAGSLYDQMLEASQHRLFYGHGCIIHSQDIMRLKEKEYVYPMQKEKLLMEAILSYDTDIMKNLYCEIVNEAENYPFTVVNFVISHLALTITNTISIVCKNNSLLFQSGINASLLYTNNIETLEQVNERFFHLFDEMKLLLDDKRNMKYETLVQSINHIIYADYENPDLCLNSIAEKLNLSPSYIGKIYKQKTLKTIPDYIMEVRMNKARELLQKTQYPITKISQKIGVTNSSYFYKTFKKLNGVTPKDFRKNMNIE